jgi:hypothetical protein
MAESFEAKVLGDAVKVWDELRRWCDQHSVTQEAWPIDPMFLEDFLEQFRVRGRSVPRAKYAALIFLERHAQAPLVTTGVHVPAPVATKKAVRGQATPLQPIMARHVRLAFQSDLETGSWRTMATALAVIAVVKPLRFAHINGSRPLARTDMWMTFWASKGKARSETGEREGFRWSIAMAEPILKLACDTVWQQWHRLANAAERKGAALPEFLGFDIKTGVEFSTLRQASSLHSATSIKSSKMSPREHCANAILCLSPPTAYAVYPLDCSN